MSVRYAISATAHRVHSINVFELYTICWQIKIQLTTILINTEQCLRRS